MLGLILSYNLLAQIDSGINNNHRLRLPPLFTDHTVLQQKTKERGRLAAHRHVAFSYLAPPLHGNIKGI